MNQQPNYQQPQQGYQQPQQGYQQPQQGYQQPQQGYYPQQQYNAAPVAPVPAEGGTGILVMGIIALSLAVLSIAFCWVPFLNIVLAVPAIILGAMAKAKGGNIIRSGATNGKIKTGRILGLVGMIIGIVFTVFAVIWTILYLVGAVALSNAASYYYYY